MTRAAMLDVLGEDYVRTARAKGIGETGVLMRHALRNAAVPVITVIGIGFALLISGVVVTESVFNLPGIGRLTVDAVLARDYPVIQAMILLTSRHLCAVNLLIDVAYTLLDPEDPLLRLRWRSKPSPNRRSRSPRRSGRGSAFLDGDADHRRRHRLPRAGDRCRPILAPLACAARSAAAGAGAAAEARQARSSCSAPTATAATSVAHALRRAGVADGRRRRRRLRVGSAS